MADIERSVEEAAATDLNKSADTESQTSENELEFNVDNVVADFSRLFAVDPTSQVRFLNVLVGKQDEQAWTGLDQSVSLFLALRSGF